MGISKNYATPFANDLMRAFRQGWRRGAQVNLIVGLSIGMVAGFGLAMYEGTKLEIKDRKQETNE